MSYVFISGIPTSGKSFLARKVAQKTGAFHLDIDTLREEMLKHPKLEPWVNFYWNQDEKKYLTDTSWEEQWQNLVKQSEAFWPTILEKINEVKKSHQSAIFESVNILPHLAKKDLDFSGIILLGESFEQTFERNKRNPRWGKTEELQKLEAEVFFNCERENYKKEAEKYGFKTFTNSEEAEQELLRLLRIEMREQDVIELYNLLQENGIEIWIDGGWGIDALLGKQTRQHKDLDIAMYHKDKPKLRKLLEDRGYKDVERDDTSDWNFVLGDGEREVDVHTFIFDDKGNNIYGTAYPKDSLSGTGMINGQSVNCIPPQWVVKLHAQAKYEPKEKDIQDVNAICDKFGLKPPENYKNS